MSEKCDTHKKQHRTVNTTLFALLGSGFALMFWHLASKGPSTELPELAKAGFFTQFLSELHYIILGSHGIWAEIGDVYLYFLFGIMLAGYIRTYKLHIRLRKTLSRYGFMGIVLASVIGVFSPLCSCGILATVVGLLSGGLPLAPAMALLISSPLMSPTAFFLTISDLGVEWTVVRISSAFLMGILAGVVTHLLRNKGFQTDTLFIDDSIVEGDFHDHDFDGDDRLKCTCREKFSNRMAVKIKKHEKDWIREWQNFWIFWCKTWEMTWMIGKYVLVGIFVGSIAENYIPKEFLNDFFGKSGMGNVIWVTMGSIPIFLHQISASAILKSIKSSVPGTLNPGAGLA
ncbi:MAG: permease, partial [bacterium]